MATGPDNLWYDADAELSPDQTISGINQDIEYLPDQTISGINMDADKLRSRQPLIYTLTLHSHWSC
ncbi:hypothetical protein DPMN_009636 [Dreissena polymorpha]|uniref:Uncharacterized protein n=1 Tax=Dreissena polymorpha TaxID=45954 RepID=A0A9D4N0T7_DREPO|nr:hypothetical protein DPMN_009521 [Dreissena polymorpha]KAH3885641.1 hypothetical protein DPMN_009636 [Dreissena polymorpha]